MKNTSSFKKSYLRVLRFAKIAGFALLGVSIATLLASFLSPRASAVANNNSGASVTGPLNPESSWGMWHKSDIGLKFPATQTAYSIGDTVTVSKYLSFRVDSIDRNWAPQPWQESPAPYYQDDSRGKEVILVRFTITNLSTTPVRYSDHYFSLVRANGREQRVALLNDLTGDEYGSFGHTNPWIPPGVTVHSFVPFLVNPKEVPHFFNLYWYRYDITPTNDPRKQGLGNSQSNAVGVAKISVTLSSPGNGHLPTSTGNESFASDINFTVTSSDVYSQG
jgi:hypothetical protein